MQSPVRVRVLLPLPLGAAYDYLVADGDPVPVPGTLVRVPLGPREVSGVVWDEDSAPDATRPDPQKLKPVLGIVADVPMLHHEMRRFVDWVARYYLRQPGDVLSIVLRRFSLLRPPRPVIVHRPTGAELPRMTPARQRVMELASEGPPRTAKDLAEIAGVGVSVVRGLVGKGVLEAFTQTREQSARVPQPDFATPRLEADQIHAADALRASVGQGFSVTLLEGVTGAGKTEVFCEAVAEALRQDRQVLVLLPEIALTQQILGRFRDRFGADPTAWHSGLSDRDRRTAMRDVVSGRARIIVGARSALFLPCADLGLIIVDEEHDGSYKQEDGLHYHARDMAVLRGSIGGFPVILSSATPSLESLSNVQSGRYGHQKLARRYGAAELPQVQIIDMCGDRPPSGRWIGGQLEKAVHETLAAGEQALLFLNRRGYAPLTLCNTCGHRMQCPHCTAWLVEHRYLGRLQCHHCGHDVRRPAACPKCGDTDSLKACGPGVERLAEEAKVVFPDARVALMTSDLVTGPAAAAEIIGAMARQEIDLLIGTQIVAKGHHFPHLTLVGVIDADLGLAGGDLRAGERTWQLLHQVSGRAGRAESPGRALIQTHQPDAPVFKALAAHDSAGFIAAEMAARQSAGMPPFGRLAALILSAPDRAQAQDLATALARRIPTTSAASGIRVLGPAPAPIAVVRGRHRFRFLVVSRHGQPLQRFLTRWLEGFRLPGKARLAIDVDPQSFL
ncbi:MAG: primosomal protein N' [Minwuia sp.]|nr:primosomal protein N' [Minwuia sp.]